MVRKSLLGALALGTSRAVRDEAAMGAACLEPAHGANAGSGKQLLAFPVTRVAHRTLGASPGRWLQGHKLLVGTDPCEVPVGLQCWSEKLGWVSSGRALSFVLPGC